MRIELTGDLCPIISLSHIFNTLSIEFSFTFQIFILQSLPPVNIISLKIIQLNLYSIMNLVLFKIIFYFFKYKLNKIYNY
jgi:hypothetical protein